MISKLKQIFRDIKEKTGGMSLSEKFSYLWEYYRLQFFAVCFLLFLVISLVSGIITNSLRDPVLRIGVLNDVEISCSAELDQLTAEAFPEATGRHSPELYSFSSPANESNLYAAVQLAVYLSAGELDCGICDSDSLEYIKQTGLSVKIIDLSETELGSIMAEYGLTPLYYFYFEDGERTEAAELFASVLCPEGGR